VSACDEGPLLEARSLLRRGEAAPAERLLAGATPGGGVAWVERRLLLAWAAAVLGQFERSREALTQAQEGPYPGIALLHWERLLVMRQSGTLSEGKPEAWLAPGGWRDFLRGQQARAQGDGASAVAAYRAASADPAAAPFARYALACLGEEDPAAVLAAQPGLFLALRCRARLAQERFRRREIGPTELLDALRAAEAAGYRDPEAEHLRDLALAVGGAGREAVSLRDWADGLPGGAPPAVRANVLRVALELAVRRLPPPAARELLLGWAGREEVAADAGLARALGRQLLRLALLDPERAEPALAEAERLLPGEPLAWLARAVRGEASASPASDLPALRLWQAARQLADPGDPGEPWRQEVLALRGTPRLRALAQSLLLHEAARRGDAPGVAALLDEVDAWRAFRPAPPPFVLRAVEAVARAQPWHSAWARSLPRWLAAWDLADLGPAGADLAALAGVAPADSAEAPAGAAAVGWFLHQAARALGRDDPGAALAFVRRALAAEPELQGVAEAETVRAALPELQRRAHARALAVALGVAAEPGLLADLVDLLEGFPGGPEVLAQALRGDASAAREGLELLAAQPDLPPHLAHHLALVEGRRALALEAEDRPEDAAPCWRRAWGCWLRLLAVPPEEAPSEAVRGALLDRLLQVHREQINDRLARESPAAALHWALVQELPRRAGGGATALGRELARRVERFGDELATAYLLTTREAMRFGAIPEGWHADYEKGLSYLCRLLRLDRDNRRLLTALVEVCVDWFLDLYNTGDPPRLRAEVERYTPFALHLARLLEDRPGESFAAPALAEFYKFRGFVSPDREEKVARYREALALDPSNGNVRQLLAGLGEGGADAQA
jgi:hypothetical protein